MPHTNPTMLTPILLPELGAGDEVVRISCWLVDVGDGVETGDRLVEVLMPGIAFDVPAPAAGVLTRMEKSCDAVVVPGDILGWIELAAEESCL